MKMRRTTLTLVLLALVLGTLPAADADSSGSNPILCSLYAVTECTQEGSCSNVRLESVSLSPFVKIDLDAKTVVPAKPSEAGRSSEVRSVHRSGARVILQGVDGGSDEKRRPLGWTASISEETGKLVLSVAGDDVGFIIFGACLPL